MVSIYVYYFVISVVINLHRHRFEMYTFVSEIHENMDMVMGIKNMYEIEGVISIKDSCLHILNMIHSFNP